jgi:hypothetical protein
MLGFRPNEIKGSPENNAKYPLDIYGSVHALFVYTNIIKSSIVGGKKAQLIRIIPLENPSNNSVGSMKSLTFNPILFYPLQQNYLDMIEIQIRDNSGRLINFQSGKTIITLFFRQLDSQKYINKNF